MDKVTSDLMICYYRLSSEDGDVARGNAAESFSISAQRLCVRNFLASHPDLEGTVEEIVDDGYSGTNMNRPGMQRLLSLVKSGNVKAVIVRDLSRFSRDFLEGGHYLEFAFPAYGVRFISINDHFDSADYGESTGGLELGITNLLNQLYSRDLSRKIKSVTDRKKLNGEYAFGAVPYGYQKGEQKNTIVVDPPAADVVRQIFQWASQGVSITQIAQRLNASDTETPSGESPGPLQGTEVLDIRIRPEHSPKPHLHRRYGGVQVPCDQGRQQSHEASPRSGAPYHPPYSRVHRVTGAIFSCPQHRAKNGTENADRKPAKSAAALSRLRLLRKPSGEG